MMDWLKQIWTIARHSIMQAMRLKLALALLAFLIVLVPALPFLLQADKTHAGQVRMVITYSLYAISLLLSVLTIFLSAITLNMEIKQQQIFLLDVKPISRLRLLLGKWMGVMLINVLLLSVMMGVTYGCVMFLSRQQPGEPQASYDLFKAEVLSARRVVTPPLPDLSKAIDDEYKHLKETNMLPEGKSEIYVRRQIGDRLAKGAWIVPANSQQNWVVSGLPKDGDGWLVIRFRHYGTTGGTAKETSVEHEIPGRFMINEEGAEKIWIERDFLVSRQHTFAVPARAVQPDGTIKIAYINMDPDDVSALFPFGEGLTVMYPATSAAWNFVRAGLMILMKLTFYSIIGLAFSTFLSFPVAVTATLVVFLVGQMANFIQTDLLSGLFIFGSSMVPPWQELNPVDLALRRILSLFFSLFPNLGAYDATPFLSGGQIIEIGSLWDILPVWFGGTTRGTLLNMFFHVILYRGGVAAIIGWLVFRRRELAALTANT